MDVLRRTGRSESLGQGRWIRNAVVVVEVALSFVLLIGSGLMVRSFVALYQSNPGFDPTGILTFRLTNQFQAAPSAEARLGLVRDLTGACSRFRRDAITATSFLPLGGRAGSRWCDTASKAWPMSKFQQGNSVLFSRTTSVMGTPS
jgi:putative ABC transport system permease protein